MNPSGEQNGTNYQYGWNVGGWPASEMWTYANGAFFNNLPEDLRNVIINTKVISGHGKSDKSNFPSTDKIYLLSGHEVYEAVNGSSLSSIDKAYDKTRQLDYYKKLGVTTDSYSGAIKKKNNSSDSTWRLRAASFDSNDTFLFVNYAGRSLTDYAYNSNDFAPAFRIG